MLVTTLNTLQRGLRLGRWQMVTGNSGILVVRLFRAFKTKMIGYSVDAMANKKPCIIA
jgi:hypothetical protein